MDARAYGLGLLTFAGMTLALLINLTSFQTGTRDLAPAPVALSSKSETTSAKGRGAAQVVILNTEAEAVRIAAIRDGLSKLGYLAGGDDIEGEVVTAAAVMAYEYDNGLPLTGETGADMLAFLQGREATTTRRVGEARKPSTDRAREVLKAVQRGLTALNYEPGKADGTYSASTERALRNFELDTLLPETGRVSGRLVAALQERTQKSTLTLSSR